MYNIPYFKANNHSEVLSFMKAHPFIILCGIGLDAKPIATHLPVIIIKRDDRIFLQAHSMRKQEHTIAFENNQHVLAIFHGAHSYVSATLYEPNNTASTWNYSAVHASGILRLLDDDGLYNLLKTLTNYFEGSPHTSASFENLSEDYVRTHMKAVVAFEIEVTNLQHVFKLSQNKTEYEKDNIKQHLSKGSQDAQVVATSMEKQFETDK